MPRLSQRNSLGRAGVRTITQRIAENVPIPWPNSPDESDPTAYQYRSLNTGLGRDLPPAMQDRMVALSFLLFRTNPLGKRLIEMLVDFVLGNGVSIFSDDKATLDVINEFWLDDYNNWPLALEMRVRDLAVYGEWLHFPLANFLTGQTWVCPFQPTIIASVSVDPTNHELVDSIIVRQALEVGSGETKDNVKFKAVRKVYNPTSDLYGGYSGDFFLFGLNRTTDSTRGIGELFTLVDYIDLYDELLYNRAEKIAMLSALWWDLKMEGSDEKEINEYLRREVRIPPRSNTVYGHNEKVTLTASTPNLQSDQHSEDARLIKSHILSSASFPGTFFDDPGTAGRAVGAEMAEPTYKRVLRFQSQLRQFLKKEIDYALWVAQKAGRLPKIAPYYISFSRPSHRDIQRVGPALFRVSQALDILLKNGLLSDAEARGIVASQVNQLGLSDVPISLELPVTTGTKSPSEFSSPYEDPEVEKEITDDDYKGG